MDELMQILMMEVIAMNQYLREQNMILMQRNLPLISPSQQFNLPDGSLFVADDTEDVEGPGIDFFTGLPTDAALDEIREKEFDALNGNS